MKWILGILAIISLLFSPPVPPEPSEIVFVAAGDMMLGRGVAAALSRTTVEEAFGEAAAVFEGSDLAFANLESVLTAHEPDTGKEIHFKGDPARVDVLQLLGLTHVSVANNHVDDYGRAGWEDSVANVQAAGIGTVGGYANDGGASITSITPTPSTTSAAFLAYDDTIRRVDTEALRAAITQAATQADRVIVSFHWGVEYVHEPTARQVALAHAAIDAGAEIVIGHHPHVLQGVETYNDGLILYSLGNFVFDQIGEDQNESLVAKITFSETNTLELIPMRIRGTFPRLATEAERTSTLDRLRGWSENLGTVLDDAGRLTY